MARYKSTTPTRASSGAVEREVKAYLTKKGFKLIDPEQGVWKLGMGLLLAPEFVRYEAREGELRMEAWLKFALLPGVYVGEMGLDGFFAIIPKRKLKTKVKEIERLVEEM